MDYSSGKDCLRLAPAVILLGAFSICCASGQTPRTTEAEGDGLLGPVESAFTDVENYGFDFVQPEGPAIVYPAGFKALEYDREGNRVKAGEILPNGKFFGETIRIIRDADGHITERIFTDFASGKVSHEDWYGPYGPVRSDVYIDGKLFQRGLCTYDEHGHLALRITEDDKGNVLESRVVKRAGDGQVLKESTVGHEGGELFDEEIDNEKNAHSFERYDENGKLELQSSMQQGKVGAFRAASNSRNQWGSNSTNFTSHSDAERTNCANNGCTTSHIHYEFADKAERYPRSAEWKDASGKVVYAAYYDYVFDSHENWTRRQIRIVSPGYPAPTLYETDIRTISYWNR